MGRWRQVRLCERVQSAHQLYDSSVIAIIPESLWLMAENTRTGFVWEIHEESKARREWTARFGLLPARIDDPKGSPLQIAVSFSKPPRDFFQKRGIFSRGFGDKALPQLGFRQPLVRCNTPPTQVQRIKG